MTGKWKRRRGFRFRRGELGTEVEYVSDELFNRRRSQELLVYDNNLMRSKFSRRDQIKKGVFFPQ